MRVRAVRAECLLCHPPNSSSRSSMLHGPGHTHDCLCFSRSEQTHGDINIWPRGSIPCHALGETSRTQCDGSRKFSAAGLRGAVTHPPTQGRVRTARVPADDQFLLSCHTHSGGTPSLRRVATPVAPASHPWFVGHEALLNRSE